MGESTSVDITALVTHAVCTSYICSGIKDNFSKNQKCNTASYFFFLSVCGPLILPHIEVQTSINKTDRSYAPPTQQVIQRVLNKTWELCAGVLFLEGEVGWEERRWGVQSAAIWPGLDVSAPRTATRPPSIPGTTTDCSILHAAIISTVIHTTNNNPHYARKIDLYHCIYAAYI